MKTTARMLWPGMEKRPQAKSRSPGIAVDLRIAIFFMQLWGLHAGSNHAFSIRPSRFIPRVLSRTGDAGKN